MRFKPGAEPEALCCFFSILTERLFYLKGISYSELEVNFHMSDNIIAKALFCTHSIWAMLSSVMPGRAGRHTTAANSRSHLTCFTYTSISYDWEAPSFLSLLTIHNLLKPFVVIWLVFMCHFMNHVTCNKVKFISSICLEYILLSQYNNNRN